MDIKSLYELAEKPLPDTVSQEKADNVGTCSHDKSSVGNSVCNGNLLNIGENKGLFPDVPLVPSVLTNPVNLHRAHVGGGEINSCAEIREKGINLLKKAASEVNHPLDDLLIWYVDDLDAIGESSLDAVTAYVRDYVSNIDRYRLGHIGQ